MATADVYHSITPPPPGAPAVAGVVGDLVPCYHLGHEVTESAGATTFTHYFQCPVASDIRDAGIALTLLQLLQRHAGMTGDRGMSIAAAGIGRSQALPKTPDEEARATRMRNRVRMGAKIVGALMLLAFLWDFFGEAIVSRKAGETENTDVEAP